MVIFGKSTQYGIKWSGVGHDGSKKSKKLYLSHKTAALKSPGNYNELSEKLADMILTSGIPYVNNQKDVEKILGKKVEWKGKSSEGKKGNGWYIRSVGGISPKEKILVGTPKKINSNSLSKV